MILSTCASERPDHRRHIAERPMMRRHTVLHRRPDRMIRVVARFIQLMHQRRAEDSPDCARTVAGNASHPEQRRAFLSGCG